MSGHVSTGQMEIQTAPDLLFNDLGACCGLKRLAICREISATLFRRRAESQERSKGATMDHAERLPSVGLKSQSLDVAAPGHHRSERCAGMAPALSHRRGVPPYSLKITEFGPPDRDGRVIDPAALRCMRRRQLAAADSPDGEAGAPFAQ